MKKVCFSPSVKRNRKKGGGEVGNKQGRVGRVIKARGKMKERRH